MKAISFFFDGDDILDADELKKMIKAAQKNPKFHLFEIARTDDEDGVDSHFVLAENLKDAQSLAKKDMISCDTPSGRHSLPHTVRKV